MSLPLKKIQERIREEGLDGWLFYDFHQKNDMMIEMMQFPKGERVSRRICYYIRASGDPIKIVHKIEPHVLAFLPGETRLYRNREEFVSQLQLIKGKVAMEFSGEIPAVSFVDGGTIDLFRECGFDIVSSKRLIQHFASVLTEEEIESHYEAARVVDQVVKEAFDFFITETVKGKKIYEGDVQQFILKRFDDHDCFTDYPPIIARGENSANPHYSVSGRGEFISREDFLLIDIFCKKRKGKAIFADITRVASGQRPSEKVQMMFEVVKTAQEMGVAYIKETKEPRGCDVDTHVRNYLENLGFQDNIYHRLGHNIHTILHGWGANLDSFETFDDRVLIPNTIYSVEPALYFPGEFGLRLEFDIVYHEAGRVEITGGFQKELPVLF